MQRMRMGNIIINILIGLGAFYIIGGLVKKFILKPDAVEQENIRTKLQNLDMWYDLKRTVVDNNIIPIEDIPSVEKTIAFKIKTQLNRGTPASPKGHLELYYASMFSVCAMTCGKSLEEFMALMDELDRKGFAHNSSKIEVKGK